MSSAAEIVANTEQLPSPPRVMVELLERIDDERMDARGIAELIEQDIAMSARALQIANSSFYGLSRRVCSVHEALAILGLRTVRRLVLALGATQLMRLPEGMAQMLPTLVAHSTRCAALARALAAAAGRDEDRAFTAGMLHDVGKIVMVSAFPEAFAGDSPEDIVALRPAQELERCGHDHAVLGRALLAHWRMPDSLIEVAGEHHAAPAAQSTAVALIGLANGLAGLDDEAVAGWDPGDPVWAPAVARALRGAPTPPAAKLKHALEEASALATLLRADVP